MSKKNGFSMLEAITPKLRLLPPARFRAWRLGWYFSSSIAFTTRARVELLTTLALFNTRDTVAVDTLARRATCSRFIAMPPLYPLFSGGGPWQATEKHQIQADRSQTAVDASWARSVSCPQ